MMKLSALDKMHPVCLATIQSPTGIQVAAGKAYSSQMNSTMFGFMNLPLAAVRYKIPCKFQQLYWSFTKTSLRKRGRIEANSSAIWSCSLESDFA